MIVVKKYDKPQINIKEILRYMGCKDASDDILALVDDCLKEIQGKLVYKVCYDTFEIGTYDEDIDPNIIDINFVKLQSKGLYHNLDGCQKVIVFAATIGIEIDRLIAKYSRLSPSKALCFQAIGAERIESLCNMFNDEVTAHCLDKGLYTRPRFSPGYGDLSLDIQRDIFRVLDCHRRIGLSLNESLLMSPSKSVTAFIGISNKPKSCKTVSCSGCTKTDCNYRREI